MYTNTKRKSFLQPRKKEIERTSKTEHQALKKLPTWKKNRAEIENKG